MTPTEGTKAEAAPKHERTRPVVKPKLAIVLELFALANASFLSFPPLPPILTLLQRFDAPHERGAGTRSAEQPAGGHVTSMLAVYLRDKKDYHGAPVSVWATGRVHRGANVVYRE